MASIFSINSISKHEKISNSKCIICGGQISITSQNLFDTRFGIKKYYNIGFCTDCDLKQISEPPPVELLNCYYQNYYNFGTQRINIYNHFRRWFLVSIFYKLWLIFDGDISFHRFRGKGRLIDIGCNEGRSITIYKQNGFDVEGLEPNKKAAEQARNKGYEVYTETLYDFNPKSLYDVAVLSNVLEHSRHPKKMLSHISYILKSKGSLLISCPNDRSWQRIIFGKYWINWHVPFHIFHFSKKTLSNLLEDTGFKIVEEKQKSPSLWMTQSLIARLFAKHGYATTQMRKTFLVASLMLIIRFLLFPLLWIGNILGRGDCLLVVAKKI